MYFLLSLTLEKPAIPWKANPSLLLILCISSVVALSIFDSARFDMQALMALFGDLLLTLIILRMPSIYILRLVVLTRQITMTATVVSPSV